MRSPQAALEAADRWVVERGLTGPDPYDGLLSPFASRLRSRRPRQAFVQLAKRLPERPRFILKIPPVRMCKALALIARSLAATPWLPDAPSRSEAIRKELVARQIQGGWGYEFDVQTRWGFFPAGSPNIIVTAFVLEAISAELSAESRASAVRYLTDVMAADGYFRYIPGSDVMIHNANVLGARALSRLHPGHPLIAEAIATTLAAQRSDGLWPYGESRDLDWVDGFHTAYVLDALVDLSPEGEWPDQLARGAEAYLRRCFAADGRPLYYADRSGPVDVHNVASALFVLTRLRRAHLIEPTPASSVSWLLALQRKDGAFVAKPGMPPYMRWNQAHAYRALAEVVS